MKHGNLLLREAALRNHKILPIFLAGAIEVDAIEIVTDHALLTLGLRVLRFTLFLFVIKMLQSTAVLVTSLEDISDTRLSKQTEA